MNEFFSNMQTYISCLPNFATLQCPQCVSYDENFRAHTNFHRDTHKQKDGKYGIISLESASKRSSLLAAVLHPVPSFHNDEKYEEVTKKLSQN